MKNPYDTPTKKASKKIATYTEKYKKGVFLTDRKQVIDWVRNLDTTFELKEAGVNSDSTEFITITINNIPPVKQ